MGHIYLVIGCLLLVDDLCYQRQTQSYMDDSLNHGKYSPQCCRQKFTWKHKLETKVGNTIVNSEIKINLETSLKALEISFWTGKHHFYFGNIFSNLHIRECSDVRSNVSNFIVKFSSKNSVSKMIQYSSMIPMFPSYFAFST